MGCLQNVPCMVRKTSPEDPGRLPSEFHSQDYGMHALDQAHEKALRIPRTAATATTKLCEPKAAAHT